jgi:ABC-2 type transport system permease protein
MNTHVLFAVFRRNFVSYFANPTGYVFICVFVLLSAIAAFWPNDFFNNNLANLDQLNHNAYLNFFTIMLVFIPAITMGIWADERRQGTDELLLTIPAGDFDVVLGKYLAAVAIFTVALGFSLVCNYLALNSLASRNEGLAVAPAIDVGLFLATYLGYWLVGAAMLSIGMVASFLTHNITIAFLLGAVFNAPLVLVAASDTVFSARAAQLAKDWGFSGQFHDFGRGVISLSSLVYFFLIIVAMLYLSMVLIGRRHWAGGWQRPSMIGHYAFRVLSLLVLVGAVCLVIQRYDARFDATAEKISSLSPDTEKLLDKLELRHPVQIEAFISPVVPEAYVQTRANLLSMLRELEKRGRGQVQLLVHDTDRYTEEAMLAEKHYGIMPQRVDVTEHGAHSDDQIYLGVAFSSGTAKKVVIPFIDRGIPVEYELVRSLSTVAQQKRQRVGVLNTDAQLYGRFNMQTGSSDSSWPIITELEKQYDVVQVDPAQPITQKYDVLLAVQPSSLGPEEMNHFIAAVENGQPAVIFEDPFPAMASGVPATSAPRQPPMQNPYMSQQGLPKGDISRLWNLLGVDFSPTEIVWQHYNPYPKAGEAYPAELVFVDQGEGNKKPFELDDPISKGIQHMVFPFAGYLRKLHSSSLTFTPLVTTGDQTGTVDYNDLLQMSPMGPRGLNPGRHQKPEGTQYVLAAHIQGKLKPNPQMAADEAGKESLEKAPAETDTPKADAKTDKVDTKLDAQPKAKADAKPAAAPAAAEKHVNVVLVTDVDMLSQLFFKLRELGEQDEGMHFDFDNVTFVLNALDDLAGDSRFVAIRSRRPKHRTLLKIETRTADAKSKATAAREKAIKEYEAELDKAQKELDDEIAKLKARKDTSSIDMLNAVAIAARDRERRLEIKTEQLKDQREKDTNRVNTELETYVRGVQRTFKWWVVLMPPIPPLAVGLVVLWRRRAAEREGVSRKRLR